MMLHPLVAAVVLRLGLLPDSTSTTTTIATTAYAYDWGDNSNGVSRLFLLYSVTLAAATVSSFLAALFLERPVRRYCKDRLMDRLEWRSNSAICCDTAAL